jgi:DNA-binding NarL/FixJ family response regulator
MSSALTDGKGRIKILAVDDHPLTREALARLAGDLGSDVEVIEADSIAAAQDGLAVHHDVNLVVLDVALPDARGIAGLERLLQTRPTAPVLVFSSQDDPETARAALEAGARGFISKRSPTRVLTEALRLVLVGGTYVPPQALRAIAPRKPDAQGAGTSDAPTFTPLKSLGLTPRQIDVLALLVQGKPNKLICRTLNLAEGTVKTHTAAIYRALGVMNRTQAVYAVNRLGVVLPAADEVYQRAIEATSATSRVIRLLGRQAALQPV